MLVWCLPGQKYAVIPETACSKISKDGFLDKENESKTSGK